MSNRRGVFIKIFFLCLFLGIRFNTCAQNWEWARNNGNSAIESWCLATDHSGNVYAGGYVFNGLPTTFGNITVPYSASADMANQCVLVKYDSTGTPLWGKGFQNATTFPINITTDNDGNIIYYGVFNSPMLQIDGLTLTNEISPSAQYFLVKFDPAGNVLWGKNEGSGIASTILFNTPLYTNVFSCGGIITDKANNIYITGAFTIPYIVIGADTLVNVDQFGNSDDLFIAKYDADGNVVWAKKAGGSAYDEAYGITVLSNGDIYIAGAFWSPTLTFGDTTITNAYSTAEIKKAFIARYDSLGNAVWAESAGGSGGAYAFGAVSDSGAVYITGAFADSTITFGATTFGGPYPGKTSAYLLKLTTSGDVVWHQAIGTPSSYIMSYSVALGSCRKGSIDSANNDGQVWISGLLRDSADIDGHLLLLPPNSIDPTFIAGYDRASGNAVSFVALPQGGADQNVIACDPNGNVLICGDYENETIFVVGSDTLTRDNAISNGYMYVAKYNPGICAEPELVSRAIREPEVKIFPNPTTDELIVESKSDVFQISVTDLTGKILLFQTPASKKFHVDTRTLPAGLYFLKIDNAKTLKFVKE